MMLKLGWKNLLHRPLNALLCWIGLSVSVSIISVLLIFQENFERQFEKNVQGIDMVIGAKGSPLQLILSAIFHIDAPTGNIPLQEVQKWMEHPLVETAMPLAYGDSYQGVPVVGASHKLLEHYQADILAGETFIDDFEVVIGYALAKRLGLEIGNEFFSNHGNDQHGELHTHQSYKITGILSPTGTVIDNLIVGNIESVWGMHDHNEHNHHSEEHQEKEITAVLVKFRNPMGLMQMPRIINDQTSMMAAVPAIETNRLFSLFGVGIDLLKNIGFGIMLLAVMTVFVSLYNSLKERKYELALMRTVGISRIRILVSLIVEGLILASAGVVSGLLMSRVALSTLSSVMEKDYFLTWGKLWPFVPGELTLIVATLSLGLLSASLPALKVWYINISETLAHG